MESDFVWRKQSVNKPLLRKVHIKLTLLCSGITIAILVIMSIFYLYISETNLYINEIHAFKNRTNTFRTNLEQQTIISHEWLLATEVENDCYIELRDNGEDFLFNHRIEHTKRNEIFNTARDNFSSPIINKKQSFEIEATFLYQKQTYVAYLGTFQNKMNQLEYLIIFNTARIEHQIVHQRYIFLGINIVAAIVLFLFSYYFTRHLLHPIRISQENQNQFVACASHELRTPLAVILSCSSAGMKATTEEKNDFLQTIESEGMRMTRLVNDMLLLAKTDNHTLTIKKDLHEPDTLLLNSFEAFEPFAKEKKIKLLISLPDEMIEPCMMDKDRISQVLAILIHNALSYTPINGMVTLSITHSAKYIEYSVADTGIGIPDTKKKEIFKRFYRISEARTDNSHSGLGLSIAFEIVQTHHGSIRVFDTPGGGSTFIVTLPKYV